VSTSPAYQQRLTQEIERFREVTNVNDLPEIYSYWSERYVTPRFDELGIASLDSFYAQPIIARCRRRKGAVVRVASLGSGNGELEVRLAQSVVGAGFANFEVSCLELNSTMQERTQALAEASGVGGHLRLVEADLNAWTADEKYDVVIASHSLHHVVALEHVFEQIASGLKSDGVLLVNDMIGRNGHMRWPEALLFVQSIWATLPDRYKYNQQLKVLDEVFVNRDCSAEGFEGIRAQDILPLLLRTFHPELFCAFANVIDVFVDRGYGHNFDAASTDDTQCIDRIAQLDDLTIDLGLVKPTHLIASFRPQPVPVRFSQHRSPEFCVRDPDDRRQEPALLGELERRCELAEDRQHNAEIQLNAILASRSWRYVQPLRKVYNRVRARSG
jgi:SAM-dependent methyltransferase